MSKSNMPTKGLSEINFYDWIAAVQSGALTYEEAMTWFTERAKCGFCNAMRRRHEDPAFCNSNSEDAEEYYCVLAKKRMENWMAKSTKITPMPKEWWNNRWK